jgi:hypothetical protein
MTQKRDTGAWLVAVYKVLSQYNTDEPALDPLEAIIKSGRAAELFSAVAQLAGSMATGSRSIASWRRSGHRRP